MHTPRLSLPIGLLLILLPAVAYADALDGLGMLFGLFMGLYALAAVMALVAVVAFWRDNQQLRWISWGLTGLALLFGMLQEVVFSNTHSFDFINPYLALYLPLVLWLNGVWYARQASTWLRQTLGISVGVIGLAILLGTVPRLLVVRLVEAQAGSNVIGLWLWAVGTAVGLLAWWLVLRQVQKAQPLPGADWPHILRMAAVYVGVSSAFYCLETLYVALRYNVTEIWGGALTGLLFQALAAGITAILAIWLEQQQRIGRTPTV